MGIPPSAPELHHRALGHRSRIELLTRLRQSADGEDVDTLAAAVGLHVNTVRGHLRTLEEAGLVTSAPERRRRPGRPRLRFVATEPARRPDGSAGNDEDGYRALAGLLAETLADAAPDPSTSAVRTGERLGRTLAGTLALPGTDPAARPARAPDGGAVRVAALALLERLGFAPRPIDDDPQRLELRHCPFLEVAREHREVVCSLHLGILRGALAVRGADPDQVGLAPFATPSSCLVSLPA